MSDNTIRVFVGTDMRSQKPERVLEHSIRKNTPGPVEIIWMRAWEDPFWSDWKNQPTLPHQQHQWATPFTMFRYAIPEATNFKGRAIYMDSDMVVLGDLAELWHRPNAAPWHTQDLKRFDVCVIDCEPFHEAVADGKWPTIAKMRREGPMPPDMRRMVRDLGFLDPGLDRNWNSMDEYVPGQTKLLHFTRMQTQPWKPWPDRFPYDEPHRDPKACALFWELHDEALGA